MPEPRIGGETMLVVLLFALVAVPLMAAPELSGDDIASFRVRFGLNDTTETVWDGSVSVSSGELVQLRDWHPRPENEIIPPDRWQLSTHKGVNYRVANYLHPPDTGVQEYYWTPGVVVDVRGGDSVNVRIETAQGNFDFRSRDVPLSEPQSFLGGSAVVERVPPAEKLSGDEYEDDFVAILGGDGGDVWVAWVAYTDGANHILARRHDGSGWGDVQRISDEASDAYLVKLGRDKAGAPWFVWSNQVDGNFDLYARSLKSSSLTPILRLTETPGPDAFHNLATDSEGNLWLVWQSFRSGGNDIYARRYDGETWSAEERVSNSPANDWEPVIAAGLDGEVHIAWDTYDKGDYDVLLRTWDGAKWSDVRPVAATKLYEAHVSLAVDASNRLWAAYNESGMNWGKDTGFLPNIQGTRLYDYRRTRVAILDGADWKAPVGDINESLPEHIDQRHNDFPQLALDAEGRMWLFGRHRTIRQRDMPNETPLHRACWEIWGSTLDGERWIRPVEFPFSASRQDVRWGVASDGNGNLFAAWSMDNRDFEDFLYQHEDVYAAKLPKLERSTAAPVLRTRAEPELFFYDMAPTEPADLSRLRGYEINSEGKTYKIYRGDTHRHTEFSMDGNNDGSLLQTYRYAVDVASLDYLLASEHNHLGGPNNEYINWLLQQTVDVFSYAGAFQPYYGYERSIRYPAGHRNILFAKRGNPTLPMLPEEVRSEQGAGRLYEYLRRYDGIAISHTSATNMGTDWRDNDPEVEPLVEIFQGDRVSAEYEGAPLAANSENITSQIGGFRPAGYVWNAWGKGYKLGVQAASDHLSTHYSYACTIAEEFTREGMMDAMKQRHSYGATDNIILDYRLETPDGTEHLQGDIVETEDGFELKIRIIGTTPLRQVDLIKNQQFLHTRQKLPQDSTFTFVDKGKQPGEDYYYVRVVQEDDNVAWSSPIWVTTR
ncbi:MAG: hypothetical protein OXN96_14395 [Bryobacterales bacterium]|nr:hypothetical protein [Bryobacterales bacterium]